MSQKDICRDDGRCEHAIQVGAEGEGHCPVGQCSMPCDTAAAHLTIPGALEWDGDNGTHGVVGTHGADGESLANHSGDADEKAIQTNVEPFMYGIIGPDGKPHFSELCVSGNAGDLVEEVEYLNTDEGGGYREVALYLVPAYSAIDMGTAAAGGFRDGLAAFSEDGKRNVLAEVFFQQGDEPFICAVRGRICVEQLEAAQRDFRENLPKELEQGEGIYTFDFYFEEGQYGEYGMCEIAPGWGFDFVSYAAFEAADEPQVEPEAFDDIPDFTRGSGNKAKRRIAAIEKAKGGDQ
jgi:hypothetical protein